MRDVDEGLAEVLLERLEEDLHLLAQLQVERAERLVEQQHLRVVHERARERDALALAAGELHRLAAAEPGQPDAVRAPPRPARAARAARDALDAQPVLDVLRDGHVREERVVLEDRVHVALVRRTAGDVVAAEQDPPRVGPLEAADQAQRGRLARARTARAW